MFEVCGAIAACLVGPHKALALDAAETETVQGRIRLPKFNRFVYGEQLSFDC